MIHRALFLGEGTSDDGIATHIRRMAIEGGIDIQLTAPDAEMLPTPDRSVAGKLRSVKQLGGEYDVIFIHRDADNAGREARKAEIRAAARQVMPDAFCVPVVPVKMTEAWLVLDERSIRDVAGNPNGRVALEIPSAREAERIADPKALLKELIVTASELSGRRRRQLQNAFSFNRRQLLEGLDPAGPVRRLSSWCQFVEDTTKALQIVAGR